MNVLIKLLQAYGAMGFTVRTGLNPYHFQGSRDVPFTALFREGGVMQTGGGIALQEVFFFQSLFEVYQPKNIFIVGNAFGWSTIALGLMNPQSKVIAIDAGTEGADNMAGIDLTNKLSESLKINARAILGYSPQDVPRVASHLDGPIDFAFIDGLHTNEQQLKDYISIKAIASPNCIYAFHDVINWNLIDSFKQIASDPNITARVLMRTPSGMGIVHPAEIQPKILEVFDAFSQDLESAPVHLSK